MLNYAEEYVYWYLRLQGFFTLNNFVHHGGGQQETDILAIKPANVKEMLDLEMESEWKTVNLYSGDYSDSVLLEKLDVKKDSYEKENIRIIAEVTARNMYDKESVRKKFTNYPFPKIKQRMGCNEEDMKLIIFCLSKISKELKKCQYPIIELEQCHFFIRNRLDLFKKAKSFDWTRFNSALIQSLIFSVNLSANLENEL